MTLSNIKDKFQILGYFYGSKNRLRRRVLEIKEKELDSTTPDLLVIMMNPGASKPISWQSAFNRLVEATPDNTQHKIMKFMVENQFHYARVINLSDICETDSNKFYLNIDSNMKRNKHSLFCPSNSELLDGIFTKNVPVLVAWGVNPILCPLASAALKYLKLQSSVYFGDKKGLVETEYYHPQKRKTRYFKNFRSWLECVNESYSQMSIS